MMIRNYKAFGLALVAMLAFGALVAQGASAVPLTSESAGNTWLLGDQDGSIHIFKSSAEVKCTEASFSAKSTEVGSINELTVTPSYPTEKSGGGANCTAFGFANSHVKTNGCTYTFTTPTSVKAGEVKWDPSQIHVCPGGQKIEVTPTSLGVSVCTQTITTQTPTEGQVIGKTIAGTPGDVTLEIALKGIHYTGTGGACGTSGTTAEYNGKSTVKCFSNEALTVQVGCKFS